MWQNIAMTRPNLNMVGARRGSVLGLTAAGNLLSLRGRWVCLLCFFCNTCISLYSLLINSTPTFLGGPQIYLERYLGVGIGVLTCREKLGVICPGPQSWTPSPEGLTASPGLWPPPTPCRVDAPVYPTEMAGWIVLSLEGVLEAGSYNTDNVALISSHQGASKTQDSISQGGWSSPWACVDKECSDRGQSWGAGASMRSGALGVLPVAVFVSSCFSHSHLCASA